MRETPWLVHPESKRKEEGTDSVLPEIRCRRCHRLLLKGEVKQMEIKCPKCGYLQRQGCA